MGMAGLSIAADLHGFRAELEKQWSSTVFSNFSLVEF